MQCSAVQCSCRAGERQRGCAVPCSCRWGGRQAEAQCSALQSGRGGGVVQCSCNVVPCSCNAVPCRLQLQMGGGGGWGGGKEGKL